MKTRKKGTRAAIAADLGSVARFVPRSGLAKQPDAGPPLRCEDAEVDFPQELIHLVAELLLTPHLCPGRGAPASPLLCR